VISEIRVDQPGPDDDEFFELQGAPGESLDGLTYLVIGDGAGGSGQIEAVISLSGHSIPADGVFLVTEASHAAVDAADIVTLLDFENDDNCTHLLVRDFTGVLDDDLDLDDDCTLDVTPWSSVVDAVALVLEPNPPRETECAYGQLGAQVGPDGSFAPGRVFRCGDTWQIGVFALNGDDTPGTANSCGQVAESTSWGLFKARFQ
jgi:hypothetical protein